MKLSLFKQKQKIKKLKFNVDEEAATSKKKTISSTGVKFGSESLKKQSTAQQKHDEAQQVLNLKRYMSGFKEAAKATTFKLDPV